MKTVKELSSKIQYGYTGKTQEKGEFFYLRITDIQEGKVDWATVPYCDIKKDDAPKYTLEKGNILFARSGATSGKTYLFEDIQKSIFASYLIRVCPIQELVQSKFLYLFFQCSSYWRQIQDKVIGAAQPNVNGQKLSEITLPLPPLEEQKQIVEKLDALFERIDKAIKLLDENIKASNELFASALNGVFSNAEEKGWQVKKLGEVALVSRGKSKHRPRNDERLFGGNYPFIQTGDVRGTSKYLTSYSQTYNDLGLAQSKLWEKGTICLTIAANIGDVAILGINACFPDSVVGIQSKTCFNEYLYYHLLILQKFLDSKANAAAQKNINLAILEQVEISLPKTLEEQKQIVEYLDSLSDRQKKLKESYVLKRDELKALKASLLDAAFKGQLVGHHVQ